MRSREPNLGIVDDNVLFRQSIISLFNERGDFKIILEAENGIDLLNKITSLVALPDILLVDIKMPCLNGPETACAIRKMYPAIKVIAFSSFQHTDIIGQMFKNGAVGYLSKLSDYEVLANGIKTVFQDGSFVDLSSSNFLIPRNKNRFGIELSEKQKEFLQLCSTELAYKEIAQKMCISPKTVNRYREDLFLKLNVKTRVGLVMYAIQIGLIGLF